MITPLERTARQLHVVLTWSVVAIFASLALSLITSYGEPFWVGLWLFSLGAGALMWFLVAVPFLEARRWFLMVATNGDREERVRLGDRLGRSVGAWQVLNTIVLVLLGLSFAAVLLVSALPLPEGVQPSPPIPTFPSTNEITLALSCVATVFVLNALRDGIRALTHGGAVERAAPRLVTLLTLYQVLTVVLLFVNVPGSLSQPTLSPSERWLTVATTVVGNVLFVALLELVKRFARQATPDPPVTS